MNPLHALNLELNALGYRTVLGTTEDCPHWGGATTHIIIGNPQDQTEPLTLVSLREEPHLVSLKHKTIDLREPNSIDRILRIIHKWQPPPTSSPPSPNS